MGNLSIIKEYRGYNPIRKFNGLNKNQAKELELEVYRRVSGEDNFPKLINEEPLRITHCGETLDKINPVIDNLEQQVDNIVRVLKKNNIFHLDLYRKNICYKDGVIYLIDFDIVVLDDKPLTKVLENNYNQSKNRSLKKTLMGLFTSQ